jgi:hypothetical protein
MIGIEVVAGFVSAYAVTKLKRVGRGADEAVDSAIDASMERLYNLVYQNLAPDPVTRALESEAKNGKISEGTRRQLELSLKKAMEQDVEFAEKVFQLSHVLQSSTGAPNRTHEVDARLRIGGNLSMKRSFIGVGHVDQSTSFRVSSNGLVVAIMVIMLLVSTTLIIADPSILPGKENGDVGSGSKPPGNYSGPEQLVIDDNGFRYNIQLIDLRSIASVAGQGLPPGKVVGQVKFRIKNLQKDRPAPINRWFEYVALPPDMTIRETDHMLNPDGSVLSAVGSCKYNDERGQLPMRFNERTSSTSPDTYTQIGVTPGWCQFPLEQTNASASTSIAASTSLEFTYVTTLLFPENFDFSKVRFYANTGQHVGENELKHVLLTRS